MFTLYPILVLFLLSSSPALTVAAALLAILARTPTPTLVHILPGRLYRVLLRFFG